MTDRLARQIELEHAMVESGREYVESMIHNNEASGRAHNNPYAKTIYRRFFEPMSEAIRHSYTHPPKTGKGRTTKIRTMLKDMDPTTLAYLTIRRCLSDIAMDHEAFVAQTATAIGNDVLGEAVLVQFGAINPALYFATVQALDARMSRSERHRINVFRSNAAKEGIDLPNWTAADRTLVGRALLDVAVDAGLVRYLPFVPNQLQGIDLHEDVADLMDQIKEQVSIMNPKLSPFVVPPVDWVSPNEGGFHTPEMRRTAPCIVSWKAWVNPEDVPAHYLSAVNAMQRTPWRINTKLLEWAEKVPYVMSVGEVMAQAENPKPKPPEWLQPHHTKETMDEAQLTEFIMWKRAVAEWHTDLRVSRTKKWRYFEAIRVANQFKDDESIYFMYRADYRGRLYAQTRGVSPQGSDLQKALIHFAEAKPLLTKEAEHAFIIHGANKFGFDKATPAERMDWVWEREHAIMEMAADPLSHRDWADADAPFQFLAWCLEFADWRSNPDTFVSRLPISKDGSCNGLQHYSAMMEDEVGGVATNLVPSTKKQDIYGIVANRTRELLEACEDEEGYEWKTKWLAHGINRTLVKRSVMTLPYGSTKFSCGEFIQQDYLAKGKAPEFSKDQYDEAARWISKYVWAAIGDVVIRGRAAMEWLQTLAKRLLKDGVEEIEWRSPVGFLVRQVYWEYPEIRIRSELAGGTKIVVRARDSAGERKVATRRHVNAIAPNMVHSCDASHMVMTVNAMVDAGISSFAMIHDDYGCHAADVPVMQRIIREQFVQMYKTVDPLWLLCFRYMNDHDIPVPPQHGTLDIEQVKQSYYFFD